jgi:hypothetical protein
MPINVCDTCFNAWEQKLMGILVCIACSTMWSAYIGDYKGHTLYTKSCPRCSQDKTIQIITNNQLH